MTILCWADIKLASTTNDDTVDVRSVLLNVCYFSQGCEKKNWEKQFKEEMACLGLWFERIQYGEVGMMAETWDSWSHSAWRQEAEVNTDVLLSSTFPF